MAEIKISELSIGDWVKIGDKTKRVDYLYGKDNVCDMPIEIVEPIPLTPEILEKNGFVIVEESADFQLYGSPECSIFFTKGTVRYRLETPQASVVCWYVHQLQHALRLAGVEKEIVL